MKFGKITGTTMYGVQDDGHDGTFTLSEKLDTYKYWSSWLPPGRRQLLTSFGTSSVHHDVIKAMDHFDAVIVPLQWHKDVLQKEGV